MNWADQVVHVAAKDARMLRWFVIPYAALLALVVAQTGRSAEGAAAILLALLGVGAIAYAVQADPAVRSDAFWVSRPLSPWAMLAAKLLVLAGTLVLTLAGESIVVLRHSLHLGDLPRLLPAPALSLAALLGSGLAIAALTRDLRSFGFAWIMSIIGWFGVGVFTDAFHGSHFLSAFSGWMVPVVVVGSLVVTAYQYGTGRRPYAVCCWWSSVWRPPP